MRLWYSIRWWFIKNITSKLWPPDLAKHGLTSTFTELLDDALWIWYEPQQRVEYSHADIHAAFLEMFKKKVTEDEVWYAIEQLHEDKYIYARLVGGSAVYVMTVRGRLFVEKGGYQGLRRSSSVMRTWRIAATTATAINAITLIWLTWRSTQSANEDRLQDETIIQIKEHNAQLEKRNADLEADLHDLLIQRVNQADSLR